MLAQRRRPLWSPGAHLRVGKGRPRQGSRRVLHPPRSWGRSPHSSRHPPQPGIVRCRERPGLRPLHRRRVRRARLGRVPRPRRAGDRSSARPRRDGRRTRTSIARSLPRATRSTGRGARRLQPSARGSSTRSPTLSTRTARSSPSSKRATSARRSPRVKGEVATAVENFRFFATTIATIAGRSHPIGGSLLFYSLREPVGVCAQIVPWNYPVMMAAWKLSPAIAAGCTVVLKPDPQTPLTALRLGRARDRGRDPARRRQRRSRRTARRPASYLVSHPGRGQGLVHRLDALGQRGHAPRLRAGQAALPRARRQEPEPRLRRREPGRRVPSSAYAIYYSAGQSCDARSRILVEASIYDEFVTRLADAAGRVKVGDPLDAETQMGSLISQAHREKVHGYVEKGVERGRRGRGRRRARRRRRRVLPADRPGARSTTA